MEYKHIKSLIAACQLYNMTNYYCCYCFKLLSGGHQQRDKETVDYTSGGVKKIKIKMISV